MGAYGVALSMALAEAEASATIGRSSGQRLALFAHVARNALEGVHAHMLCTLILTVCDGRIGNSF